VVSNGVADLMVDLRVLQVIDTLGMGGAETWLMELLRLWRKTGACRIDFLATSGNRGVFDDEARELGARIHYMRYGRSRAMLFAREFRRMLRKENYQAIHDHQDYVSGWHFLMGGRALPPVRIAHVHNPAYQIRNNYGVSVARRLTARAGKALVGRYATHITGTSRQVITEYGFDTGRFDRIPKAALHCGFDPARFAGDVHALRSAVRTELGWPADARIVLFAGRIDQSPLVGHSQNHKNSAFAVSVGVECARQDPRSYLLLAGHPSAAVTVLQRRAAEAGCGGRIHFAGIRRDIERLMLASDALLFPSRGEGLGMVAVEAQAAGLPVLASTAVPRECVVVPELVRFRDTADGAAAWAADLLDLARQPRNPTEANRRVAASAFAIEHSARALLRLYGEGVLA
jgi:glycosyltransferase EpsF